jgi:benzoyl-CoA-dihydrodiol lyase
MADLKRILDAREPLYRKADATLDTAGEAPQQSLTKLAGPSRRSPVSGKKENRMGPANVSAVESTATDSRRFVTYDTHPDRYAHWKLAFDGPIATLTMDVDEDRGIHPGYKLKLNSYDLGVDIELSDALQRIRFEHPEVRSVIVTSAKPRVFCSGANIYMLGTSSHAWKVNFCKFTNETRNGIEDSSRHSGLKFIAACNGTTAGGGYELAPRVRRDPARRRPVRRREPARGRVARRSPRHRRTDAPHRQAAHPARPRRHLLHARRRRARAASAAMAPHRRPRQAAAIRAGGEGARAGARRPSDRPADAAGIALTPLQRTVDDAGYRYEHVDVRIDRRARCATITVSAPKSLPPRASAPSSPRARRGGRSRWRASSTTRSCLLRTNELDIGTWVLKTAGDASHVLAADATLLRHQSHWFVRETIGMLRRTLARLDVTSRTLFALIEPGSCFAGTLLELALAADRSYMLALPDVEAAVPKIVLSKLNFGAYPMVNGEARLRHAFMDSRNRSRVRRRRRATAGRGRRARARSRHCRARRARLGRRSTRGTGRAREPLT